MWHTNCCYDLLGIRHLVPRLEQVVEVVREHDVGFGSPHRLPRGLEGHPLLELVDPLQVVGGGVLADRVIVEHRDLPVGGELRRRTEG